ncbi:DCC1-like thiol-disulfide oxidoreductase family protein [Bacillus inaquosorum]|uniref:DCC1-like thiol-disulfide oxidoreductase family protein n=1 Tax=Bacillus inaquosorum TaxID=483913 RepID=UPI00227F0378|nr:DCC1-like thiol-disulfide oxidoreductase family protein [Bacillus inaquosorum]MCY8797227.1 DCC1-like thiol-disulfide oxidoreductase family protein [Bacillus inaquosorum]MEC0770976.1 DCC1-like thiol-disulfide oxidoreductase family protein [Bacillus inaquosorum]MEC0795923.1 DCC1-like thiol-disulfide oxidoreductase family protein [Bacillus inaquosorum]
MNNSITNRVIDYFAKERFYIGVSLLRIVFGLLILYFYLIHYSQRYFLFSDYGINTFHNVMKPTTYSLYNVTSSLKYFDAVYHVGIVSAILFTLGFKGRFMGILNYVLFYSLYVRFSYIGDGGDNLMVITLFYLLFANTTKYFSIDAALRKKEVYVSDCRKTIANIIQYFVVLFCVMQVCIVYVTSAIYQIMGETWNNGTALYYISQVKTVAMPFLESVVSHHIYLSVVICYSSVLLKIAFPFLIINKKTKWLAVLMVCLLHLGIAFGMGLYSFSIVMIAIELVIFTDKEYNHLFFTYHHLKYNLNGMVRKKLMQKVQAHWKMTVYYDAWCPLCIKTKKRIERADWLNLIVFESFRDKTSSINDEVVIEELEKRMHGRTLEKGIVSGADTFIEISKRIIPLWVLYMILLLAKLFHVSDRIYDLIASKRKIIPYGQCNHGACGLNQEQRKG